MMHWRGWLRKRNPDEYKQKQQELIKEHISKADMVVTTALIPVERPYSDWEKCS